MTLALLWEEHRGRERVRANIMEGVESRYFSESVRRFDGLMASMEKTLRAGPWLAGEAFSLADIAYAPYITRLDHLQLSPLWGHRPHVAEWYTRLQGRKSYEEGLAEWFDPRYLSLMREKGRAEWRKIEAILASARPEVSASLN